MMYLGIVPKQEPPRDLDAPAQKPLRLEASRIYWKQRPIRGFPPTIYAIL